MKHKEDLKMAAFKKLFPLELQNQLVLNNMRLITYETQNSVQIRWEMMDLRSEGRAKASRLGALPNRGLDGGYASIATDPEEIVQNTAN